jgi:hypothetical protein
VSLDAVVASVGLSPSRFLHLFMTSVGVPLRPYVLWLRLRCGASEPADVRRLRQLEQENGRLKRLVADRDLELQVLKEISRKKWYAHACVGSRSRMPNRAVCQAAARAPC